MLGDGYQYLEQRDANDNITHSGVVGKNSAFATADNRGIYDVIAEDLRYLYDNYNSTEIQNTLAKITAVYTEMKSDPNWGATAASLSAKEAVEAAQKAVDAQKSAETGATSATDAQKAAETANAAVQQALKDIQSMKTDLDAQASAAVLSAANAKTSENNSASHEVNAHESAIEAKNSEVNAKASADSAKENATQTAKDAATVKDLADETLGAYAIMQQDIVCPGPADFGSTDIIVCPGPAQMKKETEMTNEQKTRLRPSPIYIDDEGYVAIRGE